MHALKSRWLTLIMVLSLMMSFGSGVQTSASADDAVISKILTTISATPVALEDPATITAATSTPGCRIVSAGWYDPSGKLVSGAFDIETYSLIIELEALDGYTIDDNVACYLNNSAVDCDVDASGDSVTLVREYTAAVWAPTIYKNPGNETVDEGGWASFVVSGSYVRDYEWAVVAPNGNGVIPVERLKDSYSSMEYTGNNSPKLNLYHIPYELNGWKVVCDFIGAGDGNVTRSQPAVLTVNPTVSRAPASPSPSVAVSPAPSSSVSPVDVTSPVTTSEEEAAAAAEHSYSDTWSYDARGHWHESLDGSAAADEALHSFVWTEIQPETETQGSVEQGVCDVCGYTATKRSGGSVVSDPADEEESSSSASDFLDGLKQKLSELKSASPLMLVLMALLPVDLILLIVHLCGPAKQRRRRRRRR